MASLYPIMEYDPTREALIEPARQIRPRDVPEHCVICFFREVMTKVAAEQNAHIVVENGWEDGPHPTYEMEFHGRRLAFFHSGVGAALAAGLLEEVIAFGCRKFMVCGGCGVLAKDLTVGHLIVVSSAVRDEGVSYHYLPPGREVSAHQAGVAVLEATLHKHGLPYLVGKTWTTDAPYRETVAKIAARRDEDCVAVEMEAAGLMAVAEFRGAVLGQLLYAGDDLSGEEWDRRGWHTRSEIREKLFWLAAEACLDL